LILFIHLRILGFGISHQQSTQPFSTSDITPIPVQFTKSFH
jgi:hypothetical protein